VGEGASGPRQGRARRRGGGGEAAGGEQGAVGGPRSAAQGLSGPVSPDLSDRPARERPESGRRRGERRPRPLGRYLMVVHVGPTATQIAVLEGRTLIEHYVSRPTDDTTQIDGNIYLGRVQNVLPGMEAAFVDIGTPKNAVLYRGDLRYDEDDVALAGEEDARLTSGRPSGPAREARIEQLLHTGQSIICQVTKNPIGTKGARLTQEVSLPGRFVVLIPESETYGISKRLPDDERRRLRRILDEVRPEGHGLIVRTAAEGASADELARDVSRLLGLWEKVQSAAKTSRPPQLLYREPDLAVRVIREEFNRDYRGVVIDDPKLFAEVKEYVTDISPELAERVELVDPAEEPLPLFERFRVHEQVHKALDRKVWLPSGGSIIIERTEALTVIDVNTGKNVGTSNLEETVFRNNLEAAEEIARQLRLRDIGGIIVIDFIDMEVPANRAEVMRVFREALARDKTRTQVFDISELGLVEMTRKRVSEGLVESYSETCPTCGGRGIVFDESLLG
jgi:ribonuclease E